MTTATTADPARRLNAPWVWPIVGWAAMYGPTYRDLAQTIWTSDEQFHGVIVLFIVAWLLWTRRVVAMATPVNPRLGIGVAVFGFGVLTYILGRSQDILMFEIGSQIPVLAGILLMLRGSATLRQLWFPLFYIIFMIPLPGVLVDAVTGPLKEWLSVITENILHVVGYPIARSGVTLSIGAYQLLVADACSGLHSMFSLSALGLLYMYLVPQRSSLHTAIMLASILPIAFVANLLRIVLLVLITYHFGDEAGQGFLHGAAGILLIVTALISLFMLDGMLARLTKQRRANMN